ncbi:Imidazolonepropionase [Parasphingorhabdus marina DSM 22363]|uniref:Imidazolonepropionase n=1 Tax=Parasphingorhabdus marina DSM 22363 TaxID=1123272 RepID=A0A1N6CQQ1_9SPHN|nr:amidohydrolase family protein [Parasphingorhabdus marina]SIN60873.1 Imidazolonepropionase [Parasphingorhabdus marina DSM 22363]
MGKWAKRILLGMLVLTLVSGIGTYVFVKRAVVEMFGGNTQIAEPLPRAADAGPVFITNVHVLAPAADMFLEQQTVGIKDEKITFVGADAPIPKDAQVIDGRGKYLVPGFTDSHVHLWRSENDLLLYVANGVTQIREMHGTERHLRWRSEIEQGRLGPDLFVVAAQLATYDFFEGLWIELTAERNVVRSQNDVQSAVATLKSKRYDAIKASSFLSLPGYQWASEQSEEQQIPLTGHIPLDASLEDLWASDQGEVAHVEEFVKALDREFGGYRHDSTEDFLAFVREKSAEVARRVADRNIAVTSTLSIIQSFSAQQMDLKPTLAGVELEYVNPGLAEGQAMGWLPETNRYRLADQYKTTGWKDRQGAYWAAYAEAQQILFEALRNAGVRMMAGTDANVPVMVPGFSLHGEMQAMQEAGMTTAEVLASATTIPATWMNWKAGQIRTGYAANLVLLRENPLADIAATRSIETVFVNGHVLVRTRLDQLLESVRTANDASRQESLDFIR